LRPLIYEQYLDFLGTHMPDEARIAALTLLGSAGPDAAAHAKVLSAGTSAPTAVATSAVQKPVLDLLVLTPKGPELRACLTVFGLDPAGKTRFGDDCDLWLWQSNGLSLGLAVIGTDGNVEAAIEVNRIAAHVQFRAAALVGMAAGLKGSVKKGDVVVASWVVAYEFARITRQRHISRAKPYPADVRSVQKVTQLNEEFPNWGKEISAELRTGSRPQIERGETERLDARWAPRIKPGVIMAGNRLLEDGSLKDLKEQVDDRALAAEMEGAGFAAACTAMRLPWLVVRGIADYGDRDIKSFDDLQSEDRRGKSWQFPSTYVAAAFVRDMVVTKHIPLVSVG
jgi:nucleoside phosphorylase